MHWGGKVLFPLWAFSTSPTLKARPSRGQGSVFAPGVGRDAAPMVLAAGRESVGQGRFHLQVILRVLDAPRSA